MATKKKKEAETTVEKPDVIRYKGSQLLRLNKYKTLAAKVVIKPNELYSYEEVDKLIFDFMKKKG